MDVDDLHEIKAYLNQKEIERLEKHNKELREEIARVRAAINFRPKPFDNGQVPPTGC